MKKIGILKEPENEPRVLLLPEGVKKLAGEGFELTIESGTGNGCFQPDSAYTEAGAKIAERAEIIANSEILVSLSPVPDSELSAIPKGAALISVLNPLSNLDVVQKCKEVGLTTFSLDSIPRITRAQSMDILSSMSTVAGYRAVLLAAERLPRFFPMLMTAAGTVPPAKVLVIGAGVAGLQAIATARRLGAVVEAFDTRGTVKEQVLSLGGKFVEVEGAVEDASAGGYAVEQSEEFKQKQAQAIADHAAESDVVITTALIPGRKAPILVTEETVKRMKPGAVVVDLAAPAGGNCALSEPGESVVRENVHILAPMNIAGGMPGDASKMLTRNLLNLMGILLNEEGQINFEDEIVLGTCITRDGEVINERVKSITEKSEEN